MYPHFNNRELRILSLPAQPVPYKMKYTRDFYTSGLVPESLTVRTDWEKRTLNNFKR